MYGRVHKGAPLPLPKEGEGLAVKLHQTFLDLDVCALGNAQVRLSGFPGSGLFTVDGHGFLKVPLPAGMQPGTCGVTVQLEMPNYAAANATTKLQVWGATDPPLGVISDIDDTLTDTDVTYKLELLKNTFFHDTYDVKIFANAPQAVTAISGKARASFQHFRFSTFRGALGRCTSASRKRFNRIGLPHGATILRRYSQEPLDPYDFKHPHLLEIVDANPGYKWILFGDTGEKDPEVYHTLIEERPGALDVVYIHLPIRSTGSS